MESVAPSCVPVVSLKPVLLDCRHDPGVHGKLSRSGEIAELVEAIVERVLICPDRREGGAMAYITLNRVVFGSACVTISCRDDTLSLFIVSDHLRSILQLRGQAFARHLSDRLSMRVVIAVVGRGWREEGGHWRFSGSETTFRYSAEKSS
ncbi:hypothetical protein A1D31_36625 [Bradyrhizobium liaoningense]|nr:hypothetical protein A1D31_36625 [Bradyrhizobium liaoningense]